MDSIASPSATESSLTSRFLAGVQPKTDVPLRLTLWNGLQHDLGSQPRVTVNLRGPGAFRYFLPPRLDRILNKIMLKPTHWSRAYMYA